MVPIQNTQVPEGLLSAYHSNTNRPLWADDVPSLDCSEHQVRSSALLLPCSSLKCHVNPTPSVFGMHAQTQHHSNCKYLPKVTSDASVD